LAIEIHDSDNATVDFRSASAAGRFYPGFQPRDSSAGGVADLQAAIAAGLAACRAVAVTR
jgi:hypothetical protein